MPKQVYKIDLFHGGLNSNSDPRDIADNELADSSDIVVSEVGKIRMLGGTAAHADPAANAATIEPGYGLFYFSHDRTGGNVHNDDYSGMHSGSNNQDGSASNPMIDDTPATFPVDALIGATITNYHSGKGGSATITDNTATNIIHSTALTGGHDWDIGNIYLITDFPVTGDDYLVLADPGSGVDLDVYSRETDTWVSGVIDYGSTVGAKLAFYSADGILRISDGNFGAGNTTKWYGYIHRRFFGDGSTGYDETFFEDGKLVSRWWTSDAAPVAIPIKGVSTGVASNVSAHATDDSGEVAVHLEMSNNVNYEDLTTGTSATQTTSTIQVEVDILASGNSITASTTLTATSVTPGFAQFCSAGDKIIIFESDEGDNNSTVFTVATVTADTASPHVITTSETLTDSADDTVQIHNLSRSLWFDPNRQGWQIGVSTLYDESKQESELSISSTVLKPEDFFRTYSGGNKGYGQHSFNILGLVFAGNAKTTGLWITDPRVSGFHIYMRRCDTDGENPQQWYLQAEIDISMGIRAIGTNVEEYNMWISADHPSDADSAICRTSQLKEPSLIHTFEDSAGYQNISKSIGFSGAGSGFKTAVVANRSAYVGNIKIKDVNGALQHYPDAILKSFVNKFDSFSSDRRIEVEISDGDEIVALETYADRLLSFKKRKMNLINISQEIEFLEDTFPHKGVSHSASVCRTDFGVAWVNTTGVFFYDGQKVNNLFEKGGLQLINQSNWETFIGAGTPMIGYIPKKRQLIVVDDITTGREGAVYIFDLVTQSWTKGSDDTIHDQIKTNFITDWNGDLVYAHTSTGTVVKWDDDAATSASMVMVTKDIDFGLPAVRKKIYKVYITYRGVATHVQVHYGVDGLAPALTFNNITSGTDGSSTGSGSNAKCIPYDAGVTDWLKAELKPSASINNISSFQLKISGDGSNAIATDFEINDISIVYRIKGVK